MKASSCSFLLIRQDKFKKANLLNNKFYDILVLLSRDYLKVVYKLKYRDFVVGGNKKVL